MRYYLGFCLKYNFTTSHRVSLPHFLDKLRGKRQSPEQQKQASRAISLYYEIQSTHSGRTTAFKTKNGIISSKKEDLKSAKADWRPVYGSLDAEIKLRHYSPKTLRSHREVGQAIPGLYQEQRP